MVLNLFRRVSASIATKRKASGPVGKRLYAVGDIHGRLDLLDQLLDLIREDIRQRPVETAVLVFLGDLIDRGPDSAGVIERLSGLRDFPAKALFLLGNHEEFFLRVLNGEDGLVYDWLGFGGDACAESYGVSSAPLKAMDEHRIAEVLAAAIPPAHIEFLKSFGDTVRFGDYLLVHAGIRPGIPIEEQQPHDLRWIRQPFLSDGHDHGCVVIHGHTVSDGVDHRPNRIGIDTGAYRTGILTAAVVEETDVRFLATAGNAPGCS
ncbi:serine/threonine protein phosphatase 1 [Sphingomonas gellani]|uniref:Serine/threonine protein phosphatase 1 n=1 Tax=Sphingomonas gellani TaxID=1166340 RepID=A0A1H8I5U9_9SPHN|nr:metallophosphoesterase [Sphingomonas gellani]SEN63505.1 serine/threonine protein phosphatase 1 [Sphingomonas gellani]